MTYAPKTLPANLYHSSDVFDLEKQHIFHRHWWMVGTANDVQDIGNYFATNLLGHSIIIVRNQDKKLNGFHNICRHRAGPLAHAGKGSCKRLTCLYHAWRYDLDGNLLSTPGLKPDQDIDYNKFALIPIRVEIWNDILFACLDENAPTLTEWLGDIVSIAKTFPKNQDMTPSGEITKQGNVNWKTYGDNSCEGYHVGMVHTSLREAVGGTEIDIKGYDNGQFVGFDVTYTQTEADHSRSGKGFWIYKFPGMLMHFSEYSFNAEVVMPTAASTCDIRRIFWIDETGAAERGVNPTEIVASASQVMDEDLSICEDVQKNLVTDIYSYGHLSPHDEVGTIYFQNLVRDALKPHIKGL